MQPMIKQWKENGLEIVLVTQDSKGEIDKFLSQHPMEVSVLFDTQGMVGRSYQVSGIPASFLADRQGILLYKSVGWGRGSLEKLENELEKALK